MKIIKIIAAVLALITVALVHSILDISVGGIFEIIRKALAGDPLFLLFEVIVIARLYFVYFEELKKHIRYL
jgi:hypothetical protein